MFRLLTLVLLLLSTTVTPQAIFAQEELAPGGSSNTAVAPPEPEEEPDNFTCAQEQADQGIPIGVCDVGTERCVGYQYYQYAPRASEKHGEIRCVRSECSEPITCPAGVQPPSTVPLAPSTSASSGTIEGMDFSTAAQRLIDEEASAGSCATLRGLFPAAQSAHALWLSLSPDAQVCPERSVAPWEYFTTILTGEQSGLARNFIPPEETVTPTTDNPLTKLLSGFLNFLKNAWGIGT